MSKKLLEEGSVRSFMKLANLEPLAEQFVQEKYADEEEKPMEEGDEPEMDDADDEMEMEPEMDDAADEMEMEPEMDAAPAGDNEEVFRTVVDAVANALGVEVSMDGDEGGMEMGDDELEMDDEPMEEGGMSYGKRDEEPLEEEADEEMMQEAVEAISKRVANRLAETKAPRRRNLEREVEAISKRVTNRLFKK